MKKLKESSGINIREKIIENAYNIAKERDLKNVGLQYKNYYEYILGK